MLATFWHKVPFVRFLIPFLCGITTGILLDVNFSITFFLFFFFAALSFILPYFIGAFNKQWLAGLCLNLALFFFGIGLNKYQDELHSSTHFNKQNPAYLFVKINEPLLERKNLYKAKAKVLAVVDSSQKTIATSGNLLVYFRKDSLVKDIKYGDILLLKSHYNEIPPPQNPNEFNYKQYLSFNQIHYQQCISENDFVKTGKSDKNIFLDFAFSSQSYFKKVLFQYVISKSEIAVAEALLFGYDDDIDNEIVTAYANTGTLHVLAVSGMHVGLIFVILDLLLKFCDKKRWSFIIKSILILLLIWLYSLICGLSPSILRATVMISFVITGRMIKRKMNIYNTLAVSAFSILLFNTNAIADVGFQLSYLAVLGIVFIHSNIYSRLNFDNRLLDNTWQIISISIAAQLVTFPLGLFYFHQFPNLFILSNLLIIPLTTLIIYLGILLMTVSWFTTIAGLLGLLIKWCIVFTNHLVLFIENIPLAYTNNIQISITHALLVYGMLSFFIAYLLLRRTYHFKLSLFFILMICVLNAATFFSVQKQKTLTVYNIRHHLALQVICSAHSVLLADSALMNDESKFHFHIQPHLLARGVKNLEKKLTDTCGNMLLKIGGKNIFLAKSYTDSLNFNEEKIDLLILSGDVFFDLNKFAALAKINQLIINNDMKASKRKALKIAAAGLKIPARDISETGAFELTL